MNISKEKESGDKEGEMPRREGEEQRGNIHNHNQEEMELEEEQLEYIRCKLLLSSRSEVVDLSASLVLLALISLDLMIVPHYSETLHNDAYYILSTDIIYLIFVFMKMGILCGQIAPQSAFIGSLGVLLIGALILPIRIILYLGVDSELRANSSPQEENSTFILILGPIIFVTSLATFILFVSLNTHRAIAANLERNQRIHAGRNYLIGNPMNENYAGLGDEGEVCSKPPEIVFVSQPSPFIFQSNTQVVLDKMEDSFFMDIEDKSNEIGGIEEKNAQK